MVSIIDSISPGFPGGAVVKSPSVNARDARDLSLIPGSRISCGVGNGNPLQYSYLKNSMDKGVRRATVHGKESDTIEQLSKHTHGIVYLYVEKKRCAGETDFRES